MRFETGQHLGTSQQTRLAPRIIQSMEILQLPLLALEERIDRELESNIAMELVEPEGERETEQGEAADAPETEFERLADFERQSGAEFTDSSPATGRRLSGERDPKMDAMANISARGESLIEQLQRQWAFADVDESVREVGRRLIDFIDADGLLSMSEQAMIDRIAEEGGPTIDHALVERATVALQNVLEPRGLAARDARECLLLQVADLEEEEGEGWADVRILITNHFDELLENRLPQIAKATAFEMDRIKEAMDRMHRFTLSPGRLLVSEDVLPVIPDAVIEYDDATDSFVAAVYDGRLPPLRISPRYEAMAVDKSVDEEAKKFIRRNINSARWIIEAIGQRHNTLLRVVEVVADRQRDYFDRGPEFLRPLPMVEVADMLGIHVATVSRAVADKWVQTPRGIAPLRKFFSGGTDSGGDGRMSWEAVKARLQAIIEEEDKAKPCSDEALAAKLREQGIDIARRTVVKYRQQLDIPAARLRRRY